MCKRKIPITFFYYYYLVFGSFHQLYVCVFGEIPSSNYIPSFDWYMQVVVKEEDDMVDSSDIFAHISGVNSFKYNNNSLSIPSWI